MGTPPPSHNEIQLMAALHSIAVWPEFGSYSEPKHIRAFAAEILAKLEAKVQGTYQDLQQDLKAAEWHADMRQDAFGD